MTWADREAALSAAIGTLDTVLEGLNAEEMLCGHCGIHKAQNLVEFRLARTLDGVLQKLGQVRSVCAAEMEKEKAVARG